MDARKAFIGTFGAVNETGTTPVSGQFDAIQILNDTVFAALEETDSGGDAPTGITIPAGLTLYGRFTGFTLTSGAVRAYKAAQ
jgi:hypothetical protein